MKYYVYIIQSLPHGILYKGFTSDYQKRLIQHNLGLSRYTAGKGPWRLIFVQAFDSKSEALKKEIKLKRAGSDYIRWLILQPYNLVKLTE